MRLSVWRLEGMIAPFGDNIADRAKGLLPNGFERKQVGRQGRAIPVTLSDKQRHGGVAHVIVRVLSSQNVFQRRAGRPSYMK
jgi:hypothetical protein